MVFGRARARTSGSSDVSWLIVGLGNPGQKYVGSPHNIGFAAIEEMARRHRLGFLDKHRGRYATGSFGGERIAVLLPQTFMNLSGESVQPARKRLGLGRDRLIVVHDEIDLPFGEIRIKVDGGLAGHNGLKSIASVTGGTDFVRIRVGVGRPDPDDRRPIRDWILRPFPAHRDGDWLAARAADVIEQVVASGPAAAMNSVHGGTP